MNLLFQYMNTIVDLFFVYRGGRYDERQTADKFTKKRALHAHVPRPPSQTCGQKTATLRHTFTRKRLLKQYCELVLTSKTPDSDIGIGTRSWETTYMGKSQLECSLLSAM